MRSLGRTRKVFVALFAFLLSLPYFSFAQEGSSVDRCTRARADYMAAEQEWSFLNTEVSFMRRELERLRVIRWETKITMSLFDEAIKIIAEEGNLGPAHIIALNSRIPNNRGRINLDGTFTIDGLKKVPPKEARDAFGRILAWSEENMRNTERKLKAEEGKSHLLIARLSALEETVEKECRARGTATPWEEGIPSIAGRDIYERYAERERRRQEEVESRRWDDIGRLWIKRYYRFPYPPYPYPPFYR